MIYQSDSESCFNKVVSASTLQWKLFYYGRNVIHFVSFYFLEEYMGWDLYVKTSKVLG